MEERRLLNPLFARGCCTYTGLVLLKRETEEGNKKK
jgi:hypothetical protein